MEVINKSDIKGGTFVIANNAYFMSEFGNIIEQIILKGMEDKYTKRLMFYFKHITSNSLGVYLIDDNDWNLFRKYLLYHNVKIYTCVPKEEETTFVLKGFLDSHSSKDIQEELEKNTSIPILKCSVMKHTKIPTCLVETPSDVTAAELKKVIPTVFHFETKWSKYVSRMRVLYCFDCHNWSYPPNDGFGRAQCLKCMEIPIIVNMNSLVECAKCKTKHLGSDCPIEVEPNEEGESTSSESSYFSIASNEEFPALPRNSESELSCSTNELHDLTKSLCDFLNNIQDLLKTHANNLE